MNLRQKEFTDRLDIRCKPKFKQAVKLRAEKQKIDTSEYVRDSVRNYSDGTKQVLSLLKKLIPIEDVPFVLMQIKQRPLVIINIPDERRDYGY